MLQLIANNVSDYVATDLIQELWRTFNEKPDWKERRKVLETRYLKRNNENIASKSTSSTFIHNTISTKSVTFKTEIEC